MKWPRARPPSDSAGEARRSGENTPCGKPRPRPRPCSGAPPGPSLPNVCSRPLEIFYLPGTSGCAPTIRGCTTPHLPKYTVAFNTGLSTLRYRNNTLNHVVLDEDVEVEEFSAAESAAVSYTLDYDLLTTLYSNIVPTPSQVITEGVHMLPNVSVAELDFKQLQMIARGTGGLSV